MSIKWIFDKEAKITEKSWDNNVRQIVRLVL